VTLWGTRRLLRLLDMWGECPRLHGASPSLRGGQGGNPGLAAGQRGRAGRAIGERIRAIRPGFRPPIVGGLRYEAGSGSTVAMDAPPPACGWVALAAALGGGAGFIGIVLGCLVWSIARAVRVEMLGADPAGYRRDD